MITMVKISINKNIVPSNGFNKWIFNFKVKILTFVDKGGIAYISFNRFIK
jgi:hypothetical protein